MNQLLATYSRIPRAGRWLILFGLFIAFVFLALLPAMDKIKLLNGRADALARDLARERELADRDSSDGRVLDIGITNFGRPLLPTDRNARPDALHRAVDSILENHGVHDRTKNEKSATLRGDQVTAMFGEGAHVDRYVLDVTFETDAKTLTAIIADLERAREVAAVSRVRIDHPTSGRGRSGGRTLRATISPELWVVNQSGGQG